MSDDFRDVIRKAIEEGFSLDKCGTDERYKTWGHFDDFCGMSVEDALAAQSGGDDPDEKNKNVITLSMQNNGSGSYYLAITATYEPAADVVVAFTFDGEAKNLTLVAGQKTLITDIQGSDPSKPYATITNLTVTSTDETYKYTGKNNVKTGIYTLTIYKGSEKITQKVKCGETVVLGTAPAKEGYDFVWRTSDGSVITDGIYVMTDGNSTVKGNYEAKTYTLSYVVTEEYFDNGELNTREYASGQSDVKYGQKIYALLPTAARTGYNALVWKYNGITITSATTMPAQNISAESAYILSSHSLTYKVDGAVYNTQTLKYGAPVVAPQDPVKTGYEFVSWDKNITTMPNANTVINAVFSAISYTIRYFVDGSEIVAYAETHHYGDSITIRPDYYREGYTFSGWDKTLPAVMPAENIELSGTTTIIDYVLSFVVDNVTVLEQTYHFGDTVHAEIEDPTKTGYDFVGWSQETPQTMPSHDVTIVAQFQIKTITVTYKLDENTTYSSISYNYGETLIAVTEPTKTGYSFTEWSPALPATAGENDIVTYAVFTINTYSITYNVEGEIPTVVQYQYGTTISAISDPSKTGYTFTGWEPSIPATMPDHNISTTAQFTVNRHTIRWVVDGVTLYTDTYNYGADIQPRPDEVKEGYTFSGWDTQLPDIMDDNDYVVNGTFTINQYTLSFLIDNEPYTSITADYATAIVEPTPFFEGYTFSGWNPEVPSTMPARNITFNGTKTINQYTATYLIDGNAYTAITYDYGTIINYPEISQDEQRVVWTREYATMPAFNITINGTYEEIQDTITILYTSVPESAVSTFDDFETMDSVDYTFGSEPVEMNFIVPASPDYDRAASELDEDEFEEWLEEHMYDFYIMVPYDSAITSVTIEDVLHLPMEFDTLPNRVTYDGVQYTVYYKRNQSQLGVDSQPVTLYISAAKSGPVVKYTADYIIDGVAYTSMTYSAGETIIYPDIPRPGYNLVWTKQYTIMPASDITINGTYVEQADSAIVYYGDVLDTAITQFNTYSALTRLECEYGVKTNMPITIAANPDYIEVEETYSDEEFEAWVAAHTHDYFLLVPNDANLNIVYRNQADTPVEMMPVDDTIVTLEGKQFKKVYKYITSEDDTTQRFNYSITISKNN